MFKQIHHLLNEKPQAEQLQNTPTQKNTINRREFLKICATTSALFQLSPALAFAKADYNQEKQTPDLNQKNIEVYEKLNDLPESLDLASALSVFTGFCYHVLFKSAKQGIELSHISASTLNALAFGRIALLKTFGGHKGSELANEEIYEINHGLMPVPLLVGLSSLTTEALKVDEAKIFQSTQGAINTEVVYRKTERPHLGKDHLNIWNKYLEKINQDLNTKVAQIAGVTATLAPIGTTYTSSALANKMKEDIHRIIYEQSYALTVIQEKERIERYLTTKKKLFEKYGITCKDLEEIMPQLEANGSNQKSINLLRKIIEKKKPLPQSLEIDTDFTMIINILLKPESIIGKEWVQKKALERSDLAMNGSRGFSKLMITLAANVQGTYGLGDPPEIYFAINHCDKPTTIAKAHLSGLMYAQVSTLVLIGAWLKENQAFSPKFVTEFIADEFHTVQAIVKTIKEGLCFEKKAKTKKAFLEALESGGILGAADLRDLIKKLPEKYFELDFQKYFQEKLQILERFTQNGRAFSDLVHHVNLSDIENLNKSNFLDKIRESLVTGDEQSLEKYLKKLDFIMQETKTTKLANLLEGLMERGHYTDQFFEIARMAAEVNPEISDCQLQESTLIFSKKLEDTIATEKADRDITGSVHRTLSIVSEISNQLLEFNQHDQASRIEEVKIYLGVSSQDSAVKIKEILSKADNQTVLNALKQITKLEDSKDQTQEIHKEKGENELSIKFEILQKALGHSAKEVLWALLTQIPSVAAISHLAKKVIPKIVGVEKNKPITPEQLKKIVTSVLTITMAMSGVADNVAGYMFCEGVLYSFFKETYGNDIFETNPNLESTIAILAKLIAEAAGNLSKVGNGPNFSQEKTIAQMNKDNLQGILIKRVELKMSDTLPHANHYATGWNLLTCAVARTIIHNAIDELKT